MKLVILESCLDLEQKLCQAVKRVNFDKDSVSVPVSSAEIDHKIKKVKTFDLTAKFWAIVARFGTVFMLGVDPGRARWKKIT